MSSSIRRFSGSVFVTGLAALSICGAVQAAEAPTIAVKYSSVDLTSEARAAQLYTRLDRAAKRVCNVGSEWDVSRKQVARTCAQQALNRAVMDVDSAILTAMHKDPRGTALARTARR